MLKFTTYLFYILILSMTPKIIYAQDINILADGDFAGEIDKIAENEVGGIGGEIVTKALKAANISYKILWRPWKRAFSEAQENSDKKTFIIPLTRNKEREEKFIWVSKIYESKTIFLTLNGSKNVDSMADAKLVKVGVLAGSSYEAILLNPDNALDKAKIDAVPNDNTNFKKLIGKKIEAWFTLDIVANTLISTQGKNEKMEFKDFRIGKPIAIQEKYIATTSATSTELVKKVSNAFETFKKTSAYADIIKKINKK